MKVFKILSIVAIAAAISACSSSTADKSVGELHDSTACAEHEHSHDHGHVHEGACDGHAHELIVVGVAQQGDYSSGKIEIVTIPSGEKKEFDYKSSNQDKIAAWKAGDTVSIFIDHHHHGDHAHDSITAIKLGAKEMPAAHGHEGHNHDHENCEGHDHNHAH